MNDFLIKEMPPTVRPRETPGDHEGASFLQRAKILKPRAQSLMEVKPSQPHRADGSTD